MTIVFRCFMRSTLLKTGRIFFFFVCFFFFYFSIIPDHFRRKSLFDSFQGGHNEVDGQSMKLPVFFLFFFCFFFVFCIDLIVKKLQQLAKLSTKTPTTQQLIRKEFRPETDSFWPENRLIWNNFDSFYPKTD